jgi:hypothetical protein
MLTAASQEVPFMAATQKSLSDTGGSPETREQRIRQRAYELWEREGRPEGREEEYWKRAEELLEDETQAAYPPAASRGNRT